MKTNHLWMAVAISILLVAGCTGVQKNVKLQRFTRTAEGYSKAISWSEYDLATQFIKDAEPEEMMKEIQRLEDVRVTDYVVKNFIVREDDNQIDQFVEIKYYRSGEMLHKKKMVIEKWRYDEADGQWYLTNRLPDLP